jgi:hypothetical protein
MTRIICGDMAGSLGLEELCREAQYASDGCVGADSRRSLPGTELGTASLVSSQEFESRRRSRRGTYPPRIRSYSPLRRSNGSCVYDTVHGFDVHGTLSCESRARVPGLLAGGDFVTVDLSKVSGSLRAEWMHPVEGTIIPGGSVAGRKPARFDVPLLGSAVLYLHREGA